MNLRDLADELEKGCMPYSVTKAAQLHLMKCLAATQGPKVRVNAVLPGLVLTEWVCHSLPLCFLSLREVVVA